MSSGPLALRCLVCDNEQVQKVPAIVRAGTWSGSSSSVGLTAGHVFGGSDFGAVTSTSGSSSGASHLAQTLRPPLRPPEPSGCAESFLILLSIGAAAGTIMAFAAGSPFGGIFMLVIAISLGYLATMPYLPAAVAEHRRLDAAYRLALSRWQALFYCPRCDHVYDPTRRVSAQVPAMSSLLYDSQRP